jgi:hypothetical protein
MEAASEKVPWQSAMWSSSARSAARQVDRLVYDLDCDERASDDFAQHADPSVFDHRE